MKNKNMSSEKKLIDDNRIIWKYMDFAKFMSLISQNALYFSRVDQFNDQWEGVPPRLYLKFFEGMDKESYKTSMEYFSLVNGKKYVPAAIIKDEEDVKELRKRTFAHCWHEQAVESAAMWKIYGGNIYAIAIKSNLAKFKNVFEKIKITDCPDSKIYINKVVYINHHNEKSYSEAVKKFSQNEYLDHEKFFFFLKQEPFQHEEEIRALFQFPSNSEKKGLYTEKINLPELIDSVVIQPNSPKWFKEVVKKTLKQYQPTIPIAPSQLDIDEKYFEENTLDFSKLQKKLGVIHSE